MKKSMLLTFVVAFAWLSVLALPLVGQVVEAQDIPPEVQDVPPEVQDVPPEVQDVPPEVQDTPAEVQDTSSQMQNSKGLKTPAVFQAAGPAPLSPTDPNPIQSAVDAYRAALGNPNNANNPGPLTTGRREINWDGGGGVFTTTPPVTPFDVFLNTRGSRFTTLGIGLSQAPPTADLVQDPSGGGGLAGLFNNPTYGDIFSTFSPERLFTPVGSNITQALFFVPGTDAEDRPATVRGFGAVFTDVDEPDGLGLFKRRGNPRGASTRVDYFDAKDKLIFSSFVPASPGDGSLSFFGIVFEEAIIARVLITTGNVAPGPDDDGKRDIVMMDDFFYGEPQPLD